ncbi:MAG: ribulose bisphosphate carboxylase small subunit [Cyanobacteria bacterium P01_A01_bin.45]
MPDGNPYESSLGGSSFKYPEVSTPFPNPHRNYQLNPSQSKDDSTASNSSLGGSSFKYPEPSTPYSNPYSNYQLGAKLSESKNDSVQEETSKYIPTSGIQTPSSSSLGGSSFKYPEPSTPYSNPYSNYLLGRKLSESENDPTPQSSNKYNSQIPTAHLELEILEQMREILAVGNHIAIEYVDKRRFRTGSWKSFSQHQIDDMADAIATLEECLAQHNHDYIRLIAVDPSAKRRVFETIIQRPDAKSFSN